MTERNRDNETGGKKLVVWSICAAIVMIYSVVTFFSADTSGGEETAPYVMASFIFIFLSLPLTLYSMHLYGTRNDDKRNGADGDADKVKKGGGWPVAIFGLLMVVFGINVVNMGWYGIESRKVHSFCATSVGLGAKIEDIAAKATELGHTPKMHVDDVPDKSSGRLLIQKTMREVHFICGVYFEHGLVVKKGFYTLK